ncbi:hypothetical protein LCGC14_0145920 [marine sediment metagenome]|uniref:Uncharacterized protein n=1 Tax=marine sediment metagenome TaxID=412755 RepID=A0A0F9XHC9_9ZZZZ
MPKHFEKLLTRNVGASLFEKVDSGEWYGRYTAADEQCLMDELDLCMTWVMVTQM